MRHALNKSRFPLLGGETTVIGNPGQRTSLSFQRRGNLWNVGFSEDGKADSEVWQPWLILGAAWGWLMNLLAALSCSTFQ